MTGLRLKVHAGREGMKHIRLQTHSIDTKERVMCGKPTDNENLRYDEIVMYGCRTDR